VLVGSARVRLDEVMDSPKWGAKQRLQLTGHKVEGAGTLLEVQLFLSTVSTLVKADLTPDPELQQLADRCAFASQVGSSQSWPTPDSLPRNL
jgi:hypothetical protein